MTERRWRQETPIGILTVHTSELGVHRIELGDHPLDVPEARDDAVARELDEYFAGRRHYFDLPIDWALTRDFTRRVLEATAAIPFGRVSTYGAVAAQAGNAKASRAAGRALGSNPIPIIVPCHRVIGANGSLTGFGGGMERKRFLLALEGREADLLCA